MSSAGAHCDHINHVTTQLPYALTAAAVSALGYLLAGVLGFQYENLTALLATPASLFALFVFLLVMHLVIRQFEKKEQPETANKL